LLSSLSKVAHGAAELPQATVHDGPRTTVQAANYVPHQDLHAHLDRFRREHSHTRTLIVGPTGIPLEEFLSAPAEAWLR